MKEGYPSSPQTTEIQWPKGIWEEKEREEKKKQEKRRMQKHTIRLISCCDVILIQSKSATWTYKIHDLLKKLHKKAEIVNVNKSRKRNNSREKEEAT